MNDERSGLYFHIPFCKNKCPYCDFYSVKFDEASARQYVQEICDEIKQYQGVFDTVYFGGGTPSILPPELIGKILDCARDWFDISDEAEVTVECNPSKDLSEDFKKYASYGVNRIASVCKVRLTANALLSAERQGSTKLNARQIMQGSRG